MPSDGAFEIQVALRGHGDDFNFRAEVFEPSKDFFAPLFSCMWQKDPEVGVW
jgi:hypothetical protein